MTVNNYLGIIITVILLIIFIVLIVDNREKMKMPAAAVRICLQWTVVIFNSLSVIIGILGIVGGIYEYGHFREGSVEFWEKIAQLLSATVLVISAFVGCAGSMNSSIKVLSLFIIILMGLIASHVWRLWRYNETNQVKATLEMVNFYWLMETSSKSGAMNKLQATYECCGENNFKDYKLRNITIPDSCYFVKEQLRSKVPYYEGCVNAVKRAYLQVYRYEKYAHFSLTVFEAFGIILSLLLIYQLSNKTRRYRY